MIVSMNTKHCSLTIYLMCRDGLNRFPMEFTLAKQKTSQQSPGLVILSEFVSCARVMRGAIHVNPWKFDEVSI